MHHPPASLITLVRDRVIAFSSEECGQDLIEYALVAGLIGISAVLSLNTVANKIKNAFSNVGSQLTSAV